MFVRLISFWFLVLLTYRPISTRSINYEKIKIFSGDFAKPGQFPFIVSLRVRIIGQHFCGGTILTKEWVVTAAHCISLFLWFPSFIGVVAGTTKNNGILDDILSVAKLITHPKFKETDTENIADIALIKMVNPFSFSETIQPSGIGRLNVDSVLIAPGWGKLWGKSGGASKILKYVKIKIVRYGYMCYPDGTRFCAGTVIPSNSPTSCRGDSGGPVVDSVTNKLVGIPSFGWLKCNEYSSSFAPDQYTRIDAYVDWVKQYVRDIDISL